MRAHVIEDDKGRRVAQEACDTPCAIEQGMRVIGGKWTGSILWHLQDGPVRFNDLSRMVAGASKKMITERLRALETRGLITRHVGDTKPVTVHYDLTPLGQSALAILSDLKDWSEGLPVSATKV
ncbi:MAG: winged helix-turn-helix transcriptional regulator [Paracoccaceae bacterium]